MIEEYSLPVSSGEQAISENLADLADGTDTSKVDFKSLTNEEAQALTEFQEFIKLESHSSEEVEEFIENHKGSVRVLGIKHSKFRTYLETKFQQKVVDYQSSYFSFESDQEFEKHYRSQFLDRGKKLSQHEKHAEYLLWTGDPIVFCVPPDFFTHFSKSVNMWQMVTLREFEYLTSRIAELDEPPTLMFVADEVA